MSSDSSSRARSASPAAVNSGEIQPENGPWVGTLGSEPEDPEIQEEENAVASESIGRQLLEPRTVVSFGFAVVIFVFIFLKLKPDPHKVWDSISKAQLLPLAGAFVVYYTSLFIRGLRWKSMLAKVHIDDAHGYPMPGPFGMFHFIFLSWFANCVVPARLGDAYRSYMLKQKTKASFGTSLGTILAERLIDLVALVIVAFTAGIIVFGTKIPGRAEQAFLLGAAVVVLGVIGVFALWLFREHLERLMPTRIVHHYQRLHTGIFQILRRPFSYGALGGMLWLMDGLRLFLVAWALDSHLTFPEATTVALMSALVTAIPVTPAGLGVVEAFMVWILPQVGVPKDPALVVAILDRTVTYWSLIALGIPVYILSLRSNIKKEQNVPLRTSAASTDR
jgi:uncharacterized membrane protein YbhN (UPF0104 family)